MASKLIILFLLILTAMVVMSKKTNIPKRHVIKTIRIEDGDIVDCVDIYKQFAFEHPALKNHTIQMKSSHLDVMKYTLKALQSSSSSKAPSQLWQQYGSCPSETIPVRRSSNNHQTNNYSTKFIHNENRSYTITTASGYNYTGARANIRVWNPFVGLLTGDYSSSQVMLWGGPPTSYENKFETVQAGWVYTITTASGYNYTGARANIRVWNPFVGLLTGDYSSSQVMLWGGPPTSYENKFETVQAGWVVHPTLYHDTKTHLFVSWSLDGKRTTGCFDLTCPGFVQTSGKVLLGGDIGKYNNGTELTFQISKDPETNNWWFIHNDIEVGYWPSELFKLLKNQAHSVQWGGEVYSAKVGTHPHTTTAMGSGQFADRVNGKSGMITGMVVEEDSYPLKKPETFTTSSDEWSCYDADLLDEDVPEPVLFYGGPGSRFNPNC